MKTLTFNIYFLRPEIIRSDSYEDITDALDSDLELHQLPTSSDRGLIERIPLKSTESRRNSMKFLIRQASTVNTQKTTEGIMQLTYWF